MISYAITVCNEEKEIKQLLDFLLKHKRQEDEICVLLDKPKANLFLLDMLYKYSSNDHILLKESAFQGDFSEWKNELNRMCKGDYIVNLDADEIPDEHLIQHLFDILETNNVDLIRVPRINTVTGITKEHIDRWGWNISKLDGFIREIELDRSQYLNHSQYLDHYDLLKEYNLIIEEKTIGLNKIKIKYHLPIINWCDYQSRIYRNSPDIKWVGKVHEYISGYKTIAQLPSIFYYSLYHPKSIEKQEQQNSLYSLYEL